jgi:peroxiredoxin Q/BCP
LLLIKTKRGTKSQIDPQVAPGFSEISKSANLYKAAACITLNAMSSPFNQSPLLKVGSTAPDFTLPDQDGQSVHLYDILKNRWVVLFFYPKDHSPVCTTQVCAFRNAYHEFQNAGAEVFGISSDSIDSHRAFTEHKSLPFRLLSDTNGLTAKDYGVPKTFGLIPGRVTFVIDPQRTIRMAYPSQFNAKAHMQKALNLLKQRPRTPT